MVNWSSYSNRWCYFFSVANNIISSKLGLFLSFLFAFLFYLTLSTLTVPQIEDNRIYKEILKYSPYKLERRLHIGKWGTFIVNKSTDFEERTYSHEQLNRLRELDKKWIESHVRIHNNHVVIVRYQKESIKISIKTKDEIKFLKKNFDI